MKRLLSILLIVVIFVLVVLLAVPVLFKQKLLQVAVSTLNHQLETKVEVADLKLSLLKDFPQLNLDLQDVLVKGEPPFENDTLLFVAHLQTTTSLKALFHPSDIAIGSLAIDGATVNLIINKTGENNWEGKQMPENSQAAQENESSAQNDIHLQLKEFTIRNTTFSYFDESSGLEVALDGISSDMAGEMFGEESTIDLRGHADEFNLAYNEVNYISKTTVALNTKLAADFGRGAYRFEGSELKINQLPLQLNGLIQATGDSMIFDLGLKTDQIGFSDLLALVPPVYQGYLKDISTKGTANITGTLKGFYLGDSYPAIDFTAAVNNASLHYGEMPQSVEKIKASVEIHKPQGVFDSTVMRIRDAHAEIGNHPVDFNLMISQPVSDLYFDGKLTGKINLADLQKALPLDSVSLSGIIDANLAANGHYSSIEAEDYTKIKSNGVVWLHNFQYASPKLTQQILVPEGKMDFSPQKIDLQSFKMQIGESDFNLSGEVLNYLNYLLKEGTLKANLKLNSSFVNLNQILQLQAQEQPVQASTSTAPATSSNNEENIAVFDIPARVDLNFQSKIERALLMRIPIENISGIILTRDQKLVLEDLSMKLLDGSLRMDGSYQNTAQNQPLFDYGLEIKGVDIPTMARTVSGFRKILPGAQNSTGRLDATLNLKGSFDEQLKIIPYTANGKGSFNTRDLVIVGSPVFSQLSGVIKKDKLQHVNVGDFTANMNIENGNILLRPFETKVIGQPTKVTGSLNAGNILDFRLDFMVDRETFGPDIQKILSVIPGNEKIKELPAAVNISGPTGHPKVSPDLSVTTKAVADATKDGLKNSLKGVLKIFK